MTRLLIIEPAFHHEVLQTYIEIFSGICHLRVMTLRETWDHVHPGTQQLIGKNALLLASSSERYNDFIALNEDFISATDASLVITQESQFGEIINPALLIKPLLVVHSFYYTFSPERHMYPWNFADLPRNIARFSRHIFRSNARKYLTRYYAYIVTSQTYFDFVAKFGLAGKPLYVLPMYYVKNLKRHLVDDARKRVVINGTVNENVRNYRLVAQALNMLSPIEKQSIELILLGKMKEQSRKVPSYFEDAGVGVKHFNETIDAIQYEQELLKADVLVLPLHEKVREGITYALSSKTNTSGTIADAQKYFIPVIIPDYIGVDKPLDLISYKYNSVASLSELIRSLLRNGVSPVDSPQPDLDVRREQASSILRDLMKS
ncbi:MAG: glycosyltransferase [Saprospiraceae bacterium]|nr:glycosyltransferase [Saprospiraceae bacterium]